MTDSKAKELPTDIDMQCYACGNLPATHVCRYQIDELKVQVCLCGRCMKMDTEQLINDTIGIKMESQTAEQVS